MSKLEEKAAEIPANNGGITQEQIQTWKAKHRRVCEISVVDDGEKHVGYFHRPDMETMSAVNKIGKTDEIKGANILFENCWLGGSQMMKDDAIVKMASIGKLNELMSVTLAELKNL